MAGSTMLMLVAAVTVILIIDLHSVEVLGSRSRGSGGSRSSGSRSRSSGSRSSSSDSRWGSRSSIGTRSSRKVRSYRGTKYTSSMWKAGLAVGVVYGLTSYKSRSLYRKDPKREPSICFNEDNLRNGSYGYFICPEPDLLDIYSYCCGDEGEQECCTYHSFKRDKDRFYQGPKYTTSMWNSDQAEGTVYGLKSYKRRTLYITSPERVPHVCFNEDNLRNGTYGYFICPEPDLPDNYSYCCGDEGEQECCTYTDYEDLKQETTMGGIIAGIVGLVILVLIVIVIVYCCVIKKRRQHQGEIKKGQVIKEQQPLNHGEGTPMQTFQGSGPPQVCPPAPYGAPPMGPSVGYGPPQVCPPAPYGAPPMGPSMGYGPEGGLPCNPDGSGGLPYPAQPTQPGVGPGGFVQPGPEYPPQEKQPLPPSDGSGGLPYPAQPAQPGVGPGGFVQPGPEYPPQEKQPLPPPGEPSAPPPYSAN